MKSLLFFSNPFGYGPTATMMAVLRHFLNLKNIQIYVIARGLCKEILEDYKTLTIIDADQRNVSEIIKLLKEYPDPYVVSSLNRFAVLAAYKLGIPSCFIDTLTYLWDKIPDDYLKADMYYASDFPTVSEKTSGHKNAIITPLIIDNALDFIQKSKKNRQGVLLQLGGLKSPLSDNPPTDYLDLISVALNETQKYITVCGGNDGLNYLKQHVSSPNIEFISLSKGAFLRKLSLSELCISTPGLNTTIESIYFKTPINFIMPTNLSQWVNHNIFKQFDANGTDITWESVIDKDLDILGLPEYDAIIKINKMANDVKQSKKTIDKFVELFQQTVSSVPDTNKQYNLLKTYGTSGAKFIFEDICKKWRI
ncbi:MAG: hypothetical protein J6Y07_01450 [Alphaproteobacteria bacterium]|nr:hypothetical protein [Alphaproteobacteria bacterium]